MKGRIGWPELIVVLILALFLFLRSRDSNFRDGFRNELQNFSSRLRQAGDWNRMSLPEIDWVALFRWLAPLVFFLLGGLLLLKPGNPPLSPVFGGSLLVVGAAAVADAALRGSRRTRAFQKPFPGHPIGAAHRRGWLPGDRVPSPQSPLSGFSAYRFRVLPVALGLPLAGIAGADAVVCVPSLLEAPDA